MKIAVVCNDALRADFSFKPLAAGITPVFVATPAQAPADAAAIIDLLFDNTPQRIAALRHWLPRPVVVHAVHTTLAQLNAPFIRINAWNGFLRHPLLEAAVASGAQQQAQDLFDRMGWPFRLAPDIAGMISARVVAMIINEAWFTFGDGISSREEIDTAMKWGTNYPYGPFEWGDNIGVDNILQLLAQMALADHRYEIAPALKAARSDQ
jgi:3-hydroxybutyryl-CoA dehydrogenase